MKIWFTDFWDGWFNDNNFISNFVLEDEEVILDPENPDIVFYSVFGNSHSKYNCKKVFWTGENTPPRYDRADLSITFDYDENPKNVRVPLYAIHWWESIHVRPILKHENPESLLIKPKDPNKKPSKFCAFVHGNGFTGVNGWGNLQSGVTLRNDLFRILNTYKQVDSAGSFLNNTGFRVDYWTKLNFIKDYRFTFAIENSSTPGYVTEKIMDPMMGSSVPIYWGSERVIEEFNPASFVNAHNFSSVEEIAEYIIFLEDNPHEYDKIYSQPFLSGGKMSAAFDLKNTLKDKILSLLK